MSNQNNNGCGCNCNPKPAPEHPVDINMTICDRNINVLPMLQTYTTKVLKPNICCKKNILTQEMMSCEGYKYVIKWDFDLNGQTITVPKNCILEFDGGSLKNGTIIGQNTLVINVGDTEIWGENLTREGTWREKHGGGIPDKEYDPEHNSGLGRKTLEIKDGSNVLYQSDFDQDHTVYVLANDFVLGEDITVPVGCILDFEGGSISNSENNSYTLSGTSTQIKAAKASIFTKMLIGGTWNVPEITSAWFSDAENDNVLKQVFNLTDPSVKNNVTIEDGSYSVSVHSNKEVAIYVNSNTNVSIIGTIELIPNGFRNYDIIKIVDSVNVRICGGRIVGDKDNHDYETDALALGPKVLSTDASNTPVGYSVYSNGEYIQGELVASASIVGNVYWIRKTPDEVNDKYSYCQAVRKENEQGIEYYTFDVVNTHEWGMGINIEHSKNVTVSDIEVNDCSGDSIYIGYHDPSENVIISNFTLSGSRRQGISVVGGNLIQISNGRIYGIRGTDPQSAIDIEPNKDFVVSNVIIEDLLVRDCYRGIQVFSGAKGSSIENVTARNLDIKSDIAAFRVSDTGAMVIVEDSVFVSGSYTFRCQNYREHCVIRNTKIVATQKQFAIFVLYTYDDTKIEFYNCDIILQSSNEDDAAIRTGIVSFTDCKISSTGYISLPVNMRSFNFTRCILNGKVRFIGSSIIKDCVFSDIINTGQLNDAVIDGCTAPGINIDAQSVNTKIENCKFIGDNECTIRGNGLSVRNNNFETGLVTILSSLVTRGAADISFNIFKGSGHLLEVSGNVSSEHIGKAVCVHDNVFDCTDTTETLSEMVVTANLWNITLSNNRFYVNTSNDEKVIIGFQSGRFHNLFNNEVFLTGESLKYILSNNRDAAKAFGTVSKLCGYTSDRPVFTKFANCMDIQLEGAPYFDYTLNKALRWNTADNRWTDINGFSAVLSKGTTADRPVEEFTDRSGSSLPSGIGTGIYQGYTFFNSSNNTYYIAKTINGNAVTWQDENTFAEKSVPANVVREGTHTDRLSNEYAYNNLYVGFEYHDLTLAEYQYISRMSRSGEGTEESPYTYSVTWKTRPYHSGLNRNTDIGFEYFDTDLGIPVYAAEINGTVTWKTAYGTDPDNT